MKNILMSVFILSTSTVAAQTTSPGPVAFISDAIKNAEGATFFNLKGDRYGGIYVSLRTLDYPFANVVDAGIGAVFGAGKPDGLVSARVNLPQLANGIFGTSWFVNRTHGPILPSLFLGPAFKSSWPINAWTWKKDALLEIGIPFGSVFK